MPSDPLPEEIRAIWCELLAIDAVSTDDDFFDLGGDSLTAVRLVARLRRRLEWEVPIRLVFDNPTLEGYTSAVAAGCRAASA